MSKEAAAAYITNLPARMERARLATEAKQQAEAEAKRIQENIQRLLSEAEAVVAAENSKWLRAKDFSRARELYGQAAALGSKEATEQLKGLPG